MQDQQIEQEDYQAKLHKSKIVSAIKANDKGASKASIITATGFSMYQVEDGLLDLMKEYPCQLKVDEESGEILYHFDLQHLRNTRSFSKQLGHFIQLCTGFVFRFWITIMLFTFGFFYGGIIAVIITALVRNPSVLLYFFGGILLSIYELFKSIIGYFTADAKSKNSFNEKNILQLVFAYAFGKPRPHDEYELEKIILEYLQSQQYVISKTELVMLTAWPMQKVEEQLTQMIINYRAEPKVTEEGIILYHFPELEIKQKALQTRAENQELNWIWNRKPQLPKWSVGEVASIIGIVLMVGMLFSLVYSSAADPLAADFWRLSFRSLIPVLDGFFISFWSSYFSLVFCLLLFLTHFYNKWKWQLKNAKIERHYEDAEFLQRIFRDLEKGIDHSQLKKMDAKKLDFWRVELHAELKNAENGSVYTFFSTQIAELQALREIRATELQPIAITNNKEKLLPNKRGGALAGFILFIFLSFASIAGTIWKNTGMEIMQFFAKNPELEALEEQFQDARNLKNLYLKYPEKQYYFDHIVQKNLPECENLERLTIEGAEKLNLDFSKLKNLRYLKVENAKVENRYSLRSFNDLDKLEILVSDNGFVLHELSNLDSLKVLKVSDASGYEQHSTSKVSTFSYISDNIDSIMVHNLKLHKLYPQKIDPPNCSYMSLTALSWDYKPNSKGKMPSLKILVLNDLKESNWNWVSGYENLEELYCQQCLKLTELPRDLEAFAKLRILDIRGNSEIELNENIKNLKALEKMILDKVLYDRHEKKLNKYLPNTDFEVIE